MIFIFCLILILIIIVSLLCYKKDMDSIAIKESYSESCYNTNIFNTKNHNSVNLQDESSLNEDVMIVSSREFNIDGPTVFEGQTDFTESEITLNNVAYNNNIYIDKNAGIDFQSDVYLNNISNANLLTNYKDINNILHTDNCVGKWINGNYEIEEILLETMSNPSDECLQPKDNRMVRVQNANSCVYKMWKTIRDGREPSDNSICDCCCPDEVVKDTFAEVRLILRNRASVTYRATPGNNISINIPTYMEVNRFTLRKSDNTINATFKLWNGTTEKMSYDSSQFADNTTIIHHELKNLNSYIPSIIYLFVTHENHEDDDKIFAIPGTKKGNSFKPNRDHPGKSDITKWRVIRVPNTSNKFYLQSTYNNEFAHYKYEDDGRFNGHSYWRSIWRFDWETNPLGHFTGRFNIVHDRSNKVMIMKGNLDLRFDNSKKTNINAMWWYESDESGIEDSRTFSKHRFTLDIN